MGRSALDGPGRRCPARHGRALRARRAGDPGDEYPRLPTMTVHDKIALPTRYRPFGARLAAGAAGVVLTGAVAFLWLMLPGEVQDDFTVFERATLVGFFVAMLVVLFAVYRSSATADKD